MLDPFLIHPSSTSSAVYEFLAPNQWVSPPDQAHRLFFPMRRSRKRFLACSCRRIPPPFRPSFSFFFFMKSRCRWRWVSQPLRRRLQRHRRKAFGLRMSPQFSLYPSFGFNRNTQNHMRFGLNSPRPAAISDGKGRNMASLCRSHPTPAAARPFFHLRYPFSPPFKFCVALLCTTKQYCAKRNRFMQNQEALCKTVPVWTRNHGTDILLSKMGLYCTDTNINSIGFRGLIAHTQKNNWVQH